MTSAPGKCTVSGCGKAVQKAGHFLCYEHWKSKQHGVSEPSTDYLPVSSVEQKSNVLLTSTQLGERLGLSARQVNQVLFELGWIARNGKGWSPTEQGQKLCAEASVYGGGAKAVPMVRWPEGLLVSRILQKSAQTVLSGGESAGEGVTGENGESSQHSAFRTKFQPTHRSMDGHWVRSKAEALIDNWLYMMGIPHAYERQLPIDEELYCDFYLPQGKVYIEYWGLENEPKYLARKQEKLSIYLKYGLKLIELSEGHVKNLDDLLPRELRKFGVETASF